MTFLTTILTSTAVGAALLEPPPHTGLTAADILATNNRTDEAVDPSRDGLDEPSLGNVIGAAAPGGRGRQPLNETTG